MRGGAGPDGGGRVGWRSGRRRGRRLRSVPAPPLLISRESQTDMSRTIQTRGRASARAQTAAAQRIAEMSARAITAALLLRTLAATAIVGQSTDAIAVQATPRKLSLAEAVEIAQRNNPGWLSTQNDQEVADWQVREAYASFL